MKLTPTLSTYIARYYLLNFLGLLFGLLGVVYLFDMVELIRRASKFADIPMTLVFQMGLLKLPEVGQLLFPFAVLFSAIFTFFQLTKRSELVVVRSAGFSIWQFLAPVAMVAVLIAITQVTVINPVGSLFITKFEQLESRYLERRKNEIAFFEQGLWLRQNLQHSEENGTIILHAQKVTQPDWQMKNVMILRFDADQRFIRRVDAQSGYLNNGEWILQNASGHGITPDYDFENAIEVRIKTDLTRRDIEESFASPEAMSFWKLPGHIRTLQNTGFDATKLRVHYQSLLSQPLMFAAMVLLAACVSMRPPRSGSGLYFIAAGISLGFIIFFASSFLQAMGASGQIPAGLAAWSPALISFLLGLATLMTLEDG